MATSKSAAKMRRVSRGYFSPEDVVWQTGREWTMMLGGARALLMQAAHPLAVAGVIEHSDYEKNPWARLDSTMKAVWTVAFGTRAEADAVGRHVKQIHKTVNGVIKEKLGPYPKGTPYSAEDPELLLWVHATLVDTTLAVFPRYVRSLSEDEMERYYREMKTMAKIFGLPLSRQPKDLDAFRSYMEEQLTSDHICVTEPARDIASNVLNPRLPWGLPLRMGPAWEVVRLITAGLMPAKLRKQYGLSWDPARATVMSGSAFLARRFVLPVLPDFIRANGAARAAERVA